MLFTDLGVSQEFLIQALEYYGFYRPTPVQQLAIPPSLQGINLIVKGKNGTGKTLAFCLGMLEHIDPKQNYTQALVLTPTREIALQIFDFINELTFSSKVPIYSVLCCGGFSFPDTIKAFKQTVHIAIGTIGRVTHLLKSKVLSLSNLKCFILDQADQIVSSCRNLIKQIPKPTQKLAFSATFSSQSLQFLQKQFYPVTILKSPDTIQWNIQQFKTHSQDSFKAKTTSILNLLSLIQFNQAVIFTNSKNKGEELIKRIRANGHPCMFISGQMPQTQRIQVIRNLRYFGIRIMVSTDLTSRGIDIFNVNLVLNFDLPSCQSTYTHRIGRCGRFESPGIAVSIYSTQDQQETLQKYSSQIKDISQFQNFEPNKLDQEDQLKLKNLQKDPLD